MALLIRTYAPGDFSDVDALWREAFPDDETRNTAAVTIPQKLNVQGELFLVAVEDAAVTGSVMAGYDGHRGWIYRVAVLRERRNTGVARALLGEAERRLASLGCPKVNLQINSPNAEVTGFYERLGYKVEPRISMGKLLNPTRSV